MEFKEDGGCLDIRETQSINRIRLEFKESSTSQLHVVKIGINRIRLEFKDIYGKEDVVDISRINRIRLEFKVYLCLFLVVCRQVLIESDWNLKLSRIAVLPSFGGY